MSWPRQGPHCGGRSDQDHLVQEQVVQRDFRNLSFLPCGKGRAQQLSARRALAQRYWLHGLSLATSNYDDREEHTRLECFREPGKRRKAWLRNNQNVENGRAAA